MRGGGWLACAMPRCCRDLDATSGRGDELPAAATERLRDHLEAEQRRALG